jgi:SOS-response transcriptional repressor LexA
MPHSLTTRQREYLTFIKEYIQKNESSPGLDEISTHFGVKSPTAHKTLEALQSKGYLFFGRDKISGFFIRLIERAGSAETVIEIPIAGKVDKYGEVFDFPEELGHFPTLLLGAEPGNVFALVVMEEIPQANLLPQDLIIFDQGKQPQPGDICIAPIGQRLFLTQIGSKTFDKEIDSLEMAQQYPIPEKLTNPELEQRLHWYPLAYDEQTHEYFIKIAEEQKWSLAAIPQEFIAATALRLTRILAF